MLMLVEAKYQHRNFLMLLKKQFEIGFHSIKKQGQLIRAHTEVERSRLLILKNSNHTLMRILIKPSRKLGHTLSYRMREQHIISENTDMYIKKTLL